MTTIVTRIGKGSSLSWAEMDANLNNLNNDKLEAGFPASDVANTPAGNITSTDVQAAINELDGEITLAATELSTLVVKKTSSTGAAIVPTGTTGQRPGSPVEGHLRRNSELGQWEGYDGSNWTGIGGVTSVNGQTGAVTITAGVTSVAGKTGAVTLVKGDVGLGDVDNTADSAKSVAYAANAGLLGNEAASAFARNDRYFSWEQVYNSTLAKGATLNLFSTWGAGLYCCVIGPGGQTITLVIGAVTGTFGANSSDGWTGTSGTSVYSGLSIQNTDGVARTFTIYKLKKSAS